MAMDTGPLRFDELYKAPAKAPPGAVAAAILMIVMGTYGILSGLLGIILSTLDMQIGIITISPVAGIVMIYNGYAILKCRMSEYDRGLWVIILLAVFLGILPGTKEYSTFPFIWVILFVLFRYGAYIAGVFTANLISIYMMSTWLYSTIKNGQILVFWEVMTWVVPMLVILVLLCLNWKAYKARMVPKTRGAA